MVDGRRCGGSDWARDGHKQQGRLGSAQEGCWVSALETLPGAAALGGSVLRCRFDY